VHGGTIYQRCRAAIYNVVKNFGADQEGPARPKSARLQRKSAGRNKITVDGGGLVQRDSVCDPEGQMRSPDALGSGSCPRWYLFANIVAAGEGLISAIVEASEK